MLHHPIASNDLSRSEELALEALKAILGDRYLDRFTIRLWNGNLFGDPRQARFELRIMQPYALRSAFLPPLDLHPAEAFVHGLIDITGDLEAATDVLLSAMGQLSPPRLIHTAWTLLRLPKPPGAIQEAALLTNGKLHSIERDTQAIQAHYDQPAELYRAFLDPNLVYSCAYFREDQMTLEEAQLAKLDYVLSKLWLQPGEHLLDIGCGWGALVTRAAEKFGAYAHGVTLSREQAEEAQRRVNERGLADRVTIELRDYRTLSPDQPFDKLVSVGMVEHIGRMSYPEYFRTAFALLKPGGLFLNHGITDATPTRSVARRGDFIDRYIFPDAELNSISTTLEHAERAGFDVRDVENLREHYARTLRLWLKNLEQSHDTLMNRGVAATTYRAWRLYIAGSAQGFDRGRLGLMQSLLAKPTAQGYVNIPSTRADLYK